MLRDTRLVTYGGFGPCTRAGTCGSCPVYARFAEQPLRLIRLPNTHDVLTSAVVKH